MTYCNMGIYFFSKSKFLSFKQESQAWLDEKMTGFNDINPQGSIPTFGCKYYRIGNGYEQEGDLESEAAEFEAVIEALIN
jgi:hypothetical protein